MKKLLTSLLCASMAVGLSACGGGNSVPATTAAPASQAESAGETSSEAAEAAEAPASYEDVTGKVVIYTSMYEDIIDAMNEKMEEVFPNADIEFFQGGTGTLQSKVAAEMDSGKLGCDILMVAEPSYALELKEKDYLHPHKIPDADKLLFDYDPDGYWYPVRNLNMILAYNPEKNSKDSLPTSFEDFAKDSDLKGAISMGNPLTSGSSYAAVVALLDKYGEDYYKQLAAQEVTVESGSVALTKLETGECKEIMILEESVLKKREEEGSQLEVIYPTDGVICIPSPIMIIKDEHSANNTLEACEAVEDWFMSLEGQKYIVAGWMHSVRSDYPNAPYDAIPTSEIVSNSMPIDWERCYKDREEIRTLFQENVTVPQ